MFFKSSASSLVMLPEELFNAYARLTRGTVLYAQVRPAKNFLLVSALVFSFYIIIGPPKQLINVGAHLKM
jgi:hypothetical protein